MSNQDADPEGLAEESSEFRPALINHKPRIGLPRPGVNELILRAASIISISIFWFSDSDLRPQWVSILLACAVVGLIFGTLLGFFSLGARLSPSKANSTSASKRRVCLSIGFQAAVSLSQTTILTVLAVQISVVREESLQPILLAGGLAALISGEGLSINNLAPLAGFIIATIASSKGEVYIKVSLLVVLTGLVTAIVFGSVSSCFDPPHQSEAVLSSVAPVNHVLPEPAELKSCKIHKPKVSEHKLLASKRFKAEQEKFSSRLRDPPGRLGMTQPPP